MENDLSSDNKRDRSDGLYLNRYFWYSPTWDYETGVNLVVGEFRVRRFHLATVNLEFLLTILILTRVH